MIEIIQPEGQQETKQEPQTATEILRAVQDDICINYCKYQPTTDKDGFCDIHRAGGTCPLERIGV